MYIHILKRKMPNRGLTIWHLRASTPALQKCFLTFIRSAGMDYFTQVASQKHQ
jgi:hypothetical protein